MNKLTKSEQDEYAALAVGAERGELVPSGDAVYGDDAAAAGRALLLGATGASDLEEVTQVALGRPRLGEEGREPKTWKVKAPQTLDRVVRAGAQRRGVTVSEYIRLAAAHQVEADAKASGSNNKQAHA